MSDRKGGTLTALNEATDPLIPVTAARQQEIVNISISGIFVGTVSLQRQFDDGKEIWHDTNDRRTTPDQFSITVAEPHVKYRLKITAWTSGSVKASLSF